MCQDARESKDKLRQRKHTRAFQNTPYWQVEKSGMCWSVSCQASNATIHTATHTHIARAKRTRSVFSKNFQKPHSMRIPYFLANPPVLFPVSLVFMKDVGKIAEDSAFRDLPDPAQWVEDGQQEQRQQFSNDSLAATRQREQQERVDHKLKPQKDVDRKLEPENVKKNKHLFLQNWRGVDHKLKP